MSREFIQSDEGRRESIMPPRFNEREEPPEIGVIRELSPRKVKEQVRMELKGFIYSNEKKDWVKDENNVPLMNELGIQKYIQCFSAITDTVTFSNFTVEQIKDLTLFIIKQTIPSIYVNYKEYGISKSDLPILTSKLLVLTYSALQKAAGAGDRGVIGRTIQESINTRAGLQQMPMGNIHERRGFFSRINPFVR